MPENFFTSLPPSVSLDEALSGVLQNASETASETRSYKPPASVAELYDTIPASIIIVDAGMRLIGWNRFSRDTINGLSDQEMPGVNPLNRVHPDDFDEISRKVRDIIHLDAEESAEFRMFHKEGPPYKWAMFRGKRAIIESQPCMVAVVTEISELKEAEEQQRKLQEQLLQYQKMELVGQLAGGIAHDFNNALAAIIGQTELALNKLDSASQAVGHIDDIRMLALRSAEMTRKLLAFARKQEATPKVIELNEAVTESLRLHRSLIGKRIRLEWQPLGEPVQVMLDPVQLDQILSNLLVNARDAITGSGTIRIGCETVRLESAPEVCAKLSVSDTGSGIDAEALAHIFEPFFTTKAVGKGTGLGLSTVYGIVTQNKGRIECHSEHGKGTTFEIFLPLYGDSMPESGDGCVSEEGVSGGKETIMVVDSEPSILDLIRDILESRECSVLTAGDAEECLKIAAEHDAMIDLAVTDLALPAMDGIELSQLLRERNPAMKLLFMSAHALEREGRQTPFEEAEFIQKPFGIDEFNGAIERVLKPGRETR